MRADGEMLDRVLALLPAAEADWVARKLTADRDDAGWSRRARDEAVRAGLRTFSGAWPTIDAKGLARAYDAYLAGDWQRDRADGAAPAVGGERRAALFRLALLNDERPLRWRRIYDIGIAVAEK